MSDLEDLAKKLSEKEEVYPARERKIGWRRLSSFIRKKGFDTETDEHISSFWRATSPRPSSLGGVKQEKTMRLGTTFLWAFIIAIILFVIAGGLFFFLAGGGIIGGRNVTFSLSGPSQAASGSEMVWRVTVHNDNAQAIEGAELVVTFPDGERAREHLGKIEAGAEEVREIRRVVFGSTGQEIVLKAVLEYRPQGSSAFFAKEETASLAITSSLIGIAFDAPREIRGDQSTALTIKITSSADTITRDLSFGIEYPEDFLFEEALPAPIDGRQRWRLGDLNPHEERTIAIRGTMKQGITPQKTFRMKVGVFNAEGETWRLVAQEAGTIMVRSSLLSMATAIETQKAGVVFPGESVTVTLSWKNNLPVAVENVIIEATPEGEAFEKGSLRVNDATYDEARNAIRWDASKRPDLALVSPGGEGRASFSLRVSKTLPVRTLEDRNFIARVIGRIFPDTIPEGYQKEDLASNSSAEVKVASELALAQQGYFFHTTLAGSGPLPPEVGKETIYTMVWSLKNSSNALEEVTVKAFLPSYARWKGVVSPGGTSVAYAESRSEISWRIGAVPAGTGFSRPAKEVAFQIGFVPTSFHKGGDAELISEADAQGSDVFAGVFLSSTARAVTSAIPDDAKLTIDQRKVK